MNIATVNMAHVYCVESEGAYNCNKKQSTLAVLGYDTIETNNWMELWGDGGMNLFRFTISCIESLIYWKMIIQVVLFVL